MQLILQNENCKQLLLFILNFTNSIQRGKPGIEYTHLHHLIIFQMQHNTTLIGSNEKQKVISSLRAVI